MQEGSLLNFARMLPQRLLKTLDSYALESLDLGTKDPSFTELFPSSCAKEEISPLEMELEGKVSMEELSLMRISLSHIKERVS